MQQQPATEVVHEYIRSAVTSWSIPQAASLDPDVMRDLYRGSLLWGAVGDALGPPSARILPTSALGSVLMGCRNSCRGAGGTVVRRGPSPTTRNSRWQSPNPCAPQVGNLDPDHFARSLVALLLVLGLLQKLLQKTDVAVEDGAVMNS
jgi:hypothetical protein